MEVFINYFHLNRIENKIDIHKKVEVELEN